MTSWPQIKLGQVAVGSNIAPLEYLYNSLMPKSVMVRYIHYICKSLPPAFITQADQRTPKKADM